MESSNIVTLIFVVAAVFIFMQLRNVLGSRTGHEKPPVEKDARNAHDDNPEMDNDNVVTLPSRGLTESNIYKEIDLIAKPRTQLNKTLRQIKDEAPIFDPKEFTKGAGMAYEMIIMAFADGDRKTLRGLLSKEVFDGFSDVLDERTKTGEQVHTNFVGIEKNEITAAEVRDHDAHITVSIVSQLISSTKNQAGEVIDGDPEAIVEVRDIWTFARDLRQRDPNWKLVATESEE